MTIVLASRPPRVLSRGIAMAGRDAASRAFAYASKPREAPETRPPPLGADAISAFTRVFDALWSSQTVKPNLLHPARDRANNRRGGAPRGERLR